MKGVRSGSHLELIGDTWYYRRAVPSDVREAFGKRTIRVSLRTTSLTEATRLEKKHDVDFESRLRAARPTELDGYPKNRNERIRYFSETIFKEKRGRGPWDQELAKIPQADRIEVAQAIKGLAFRQGWSEEIVLRSCDELKDLLFLAVAEKTEVWAEIQQALVGILRDYFEIGSNPTIDWALQEWLKAKHRPRQTEDEARRYIEDFKKSARLRALTSIRRRHVTDWRDKLRQAGDLAPKSINHRLEIVSAILRAGWREAEISAPDLERVMVPEPVESGRTSWSRDELLKALQALEPRSWSAWVFVIALTTGTRLGEPVAAVKDWYDFPGCIRVRAEFTKMKKPHALPIIELIREPLVEHISRLPAGAYMFDAPRPAKTDLKIGREASKWFSRFFDRHKIEKVFHELRHTWVQAARESPIKKEIYEIISGHARTIGSDAYGGAKPDELIAANQTICHKLLDPEMIIAVRRLVS